MREMGRKLVEAVPDTGFWAEAGYDTLPEGGMHPFSFRIFLKAESPGDQKDRIDGIRAKPDQFPRKVQGELPQAGVEVVGFV